MNKNIPQTNIKFERSFYFMARNKVEISGLNTSKIITIKSKEMNDLL